MGRGGRGASRGLVAFLVFVIVIGVAIWFWRGRADAETAPQIDPGVPAVVNRPPATATPTAAAVRPTSAPAAATRPAAGAVVALTASTTRPIAATTSPTTRALVTGVLGSAKSMIDAGDLLAARKILNDAIQSRSLSPGDELAAKQLLGQVSQTVVFSTKRFPSDDYGGTYTVRSGDNLTRIASQHELTWELLARINGISDPRRLRAGQTLKVVKGPFHALVDKSRFTIEIYLGAAPGEKGSMYVSSFPVGLGKDDSTPTGVWLVEPHNKLKNPKFWGAADLPAREADDPLNPLGEFWVGLTGTDGHALGKQGYGIHGTIEPDSIGQQASMGCIRLRNDDIALVFELLVDGRSTVVVK